MCMDIKYGYAALLLRRHNIKAMESCCSECETPVFQRNPRKRRIPFENADQQDNCFTQEGDECNIGWFWTSQHSLGCRSALVYDSYRELAWGGSRRSSTVMPRQLRSEYHSIGHIVVCHRARWS